MTPLKANVPAPTANRSNLEIWPGETRRSLFARLREEVETLHMLGLSHDAIADVLEIAIQDVRALCPTSRQKTITRVLSRRALVALLDGRHAAIGGNTLAERTQRLVTIASSYTQDEFASEPGVGSVTVMEVSLWLNERGLSFRSPEIPWRAARGPWRRSSRSSPPEEP